MQSLINALGKDIKKQGKNWIAKCPVHNDKDFAMSVKETSNGVTVTCYACGANGVDVYRHLGLDLSELFNEQKDSWIPQKIRDNYIEDKLVVALYNKQEKLTLADKKRHRLAINRIAGAENKYPQVCFT